MACGNVSPCQVSPVFALLALMGAPLKLHRRPRSEMYCVGDCAHHSGSSPVTHVRLFALCTCATATYLRAYNSTSGPRKASAGAVEQCCAPVRAVAFLLVG